MPTLMTQQLLTMEIFNHRFYKNLDDNVSCSDMGENDIIVCFELPCNAQQARSFKAQDNDPVIVPVIMCEPPTRTRSYNNQPTFFGYPFVLAIDSESAKSKDAIYDAIVDRLQRWTTRVQDLYQWEPGSSSSKINGIPLDTSDSPSFEIITEIKENGEIVTVQEPVPEEGDIVDEKNVVIQEHEDAMDEDDVPPRRLGIKRDLFRMLVFPCSEKYGVGYGNILSNTKSETLDQRAEKADDRAASLLQENDLIVLEFDEHLKEYYWGESPKYELARWDMWEDFVHPEYKEAQEAASAKKSRGISLQDCLDEFTKEEQLGEDDLWYCPNCKKHQQATKRFDLWSVPDVLVVHLKRFSNSRALRDKIDALVDFPLEGLDLTSMVGERKVVKKLLEAGEDLKALGLDDTEEPLLYDLFAVDEHLGGLGGGHYRAYAYNHDDKQWYHFDDSYVSPARPEAAVVRLLTRNLVHSANHYLNRTRTPIFYSTEGELRGH